MYLIEWEALYRPWHTCDAQNLPLKYVLHKVQTKQIFPPVLIRRHDIFVYTHTYTQMYDQGGSIALFGSCTIIKLTPHKHQEGSPLRDIENFFRITNFRGIITGPVAYD